MNVQLLQKKVQERLNKLSSFDYGNIEPWAIVEAFNKAQLQWVRRQLQGINQTRTGAEGSIRRIDDLNVILVSGSLSVSLQDVYVEGSLPADYMEWNRVSMKGKNECCPDRAFVVFLASEDDKDILLADRSKQPSFAWATTFATIAAGKVRIYTNNDFLVSSATISYYRYPRNIQIAGTPDIYLPGAPVSPVDVESELPEDVQEILVDETVGILATDIQEYYKASAVQQSAQLNT
jgi:hypothetical protein